MKAAKELAEIYEEHKVGLTAYGSQEIRITESFFDDLYNNDLLRLDASGRYYLIELLTATIPDFAMSLVEEMTNQDMTTVIAHPERSHAFAKDMNLLYNFIKAGCLTQITSSSYCGYYGEKLQETAKQMIELNLVHIIASDVHHLKHRPINMTAVFSQLQEDFGGEKVAYFKDNARSIFNGDTVQILKHKTTVKNGSDYSEKLLEETKCLTLL